MKRGDQRALLAAAVLLVAVALLDDLTPVDVDMGLAYMLPVILAAWVVGRNAGIAFALLATLAQLVLDTATRAFLPNVSAFNALSRMVVLAALAVVVNRVYEERSRARQTDHERNRLLGLLERELPRPLQALDWIGRTFDEALENGNVEALRGQLRSLRHNLRQVRFLANDVVTVGRVDSGAFTFARQSFDFKVAVTDAVSETIDRGRVALSVSADPLTVVGDLDCLRHAVGSVLGRALEVSPRDLVQVLVRPSTTEAAVEISSGAQTIDIADLELAKLLLTSIGGRLTTVNAGARGIIVTLLLPLADAEGNALGRPATDTSRRA